MLKQLFTSVSVNSVDIYLAATSTLVNNCSLFRTGEGLSSLQFNVPQRWYETLLAHLDLPAPSCDANGDAWRDPFSDWLRENAL